MKPIEMTSVISSNISKIGYADKIQVLRVEFKHGKIYDYHSVPKTLFNELMASPSKGKFLNSNVIGKYTHEKIL